MIDKDEGWAIGVTRDDDGKRESKRRKKGSNKMAREKEEEVGRAGTKEATEKVEILWKYIFKIIKI